MNLAQGIKMALKSLATNKFRSFLTMLGIIIGVAAVIALVSLGQGSTKQVTDQVQSLGTNLLTVNIIGRGAKDALDYDEAMAFQEKPGVQAVAPVVNGSAKVKVGENNTDVSVEGTNPAYETVRDFHVQEGRFLLPIDVQYRQKVALIGATTAQELFGFMDPIGQYVQINGTPFKIVGLLEQKGSSMGGSNDEKIMIPISTAQRLFQSSGVKTIYLQADSPDNVNSVAALIEQSLTNKFRGKENSFRVFNQQDMLSTMSSITTTMTLMLGGVAGISLLVGGIGIMNIMLVSVTERTREIGIRKAIGAKKRDILVQFLIESIVLSAIGGLLGIAIGIGGGLLVAQATGIAAAISWNIVMIALVFSAGIGIFFGLFPANKASNLKPIEALRFE